MLYIKLESDGANPITGKNFDTYALMAVGMTMEQAAVACCTTDLCPDCESMPIDTHKRGRVRKQQAG